MTADQRQALAGRGRTTRISAVPAATASHRDSADPPPARERVNPGRTEPEGQRVQRVEPGVQRHFDADRGKDATNSPLIHAAARPATCVGPHEDRDDEQTTEQDRGQARHDQAVAEQLEPPRTTSCRVRPATVDSFGNARHASRNQPRAASSVYSSSKLASCPSRPAAPRAPGPARTRRRPRAGRAARPLVQPRARPPAGRLSNISAPLPTPGG